MNDTPTRLPKPTATGEGVIRFVCPGCGKACTARQQAAGRTARCSSCDTPIVVPTPNPASKAKASNKSKKPLASSERITIACRHCATRFDVAARHEGRGVKCPDCGVVNRVAKREPPPKPPKRQTDNDSDAYELFEGDDQPWAADLIAAQPKQLPITCGLCGTLMHASESQIGSTIVCPDCGTGSVVREPRTPARPRPMIDVDDDPLEVEAATDDTRTRIDPDEYLKNPPLGLRGAVADEPATRRPTRRPRRLAIATDALRCWRSPGLIGMSIVTSLVLIVSHLAPASVSAGGMGPGFGAIAWVCLLVMMVATWALAAAVLSTILIELITESSHGGDRPRAWPNLDPSEWFAPLTYTAIAGVTSAAAGVATLSFQPTWGAVPVCVSLWLLLPVVTLSQLENATPLGVFSPRVARSFLRSSGAWLVFYAVSFPAMIGTGVLYEYLAGSGWGILWCDLAWMPVLVFTIVFEARLIGLLAWVLEHEAITLEPRD